MSESNTVFQNVIRKIHRLCTKNPFVLSAWEAMFVFVVSNFALVFLVFAHVVSTQGERLSVDIAVKVIRNAVSPSEYLVYIVAIIAPALWIMMFQWRARRHPPIYFTLFVVQGLIVITSAYIYGRAKFGTIENMDFVSSWGKVCYAAGLVIWYITLVYDKWLDTLEVPIPPISGAEILRNLGGR